MAESNADVYASFGVTNAVTTSETQAEHVQNMLALDVAARDGDDAIVLQENDIVESRNDDPYGNPDKFSEPDENRVQVRISTDGSEPDDIDIINNGEVIQEGTEGEPEEFAALGETPDGLKSSSDQLGNYEDGLQEMIDTASENGLSEEMIIRVQEEYQSDEGISDESYEALAKAGYSRAFVESYIRGQEALVTEYVNQVKEFAGGPAKFDKLVAHLESTNADAAESLIEALEARNLSTVKTILNLAGQSYNAKFGKSAQRSLASRAVPSKAEPKKAEGFATQADMIKAMSDSRYRTDTQYRREVEQKVINSSF